MKRMLVSNEWDSKIERTRQSASSATEILVATPFAKEYYDDCGQVSLMPLGLNTDLFRPRNKDELRDKYGLSKTATIGYWGGTNHVMKGSNSLFKYAAEHPEITWIVVWKHQSERASLPSFMQANTKEYCLIPQETIAELMSCCDFFLCTSLLRPYYMTELEAMSCNLKFIFTENIEKDFCPSDNPREDIFKYNWDRTSIKKMWESLFNKYLQ